MAEMAFSRDVERALLANSGGRCANPDCRKNLLVEWEGRRATVAEMAHIIGRSRGGPRGDGDLPDEDRDDYDNAVLLCPNCHTLVDEMPDLYPPERLAEWKRRREREVADGTGVPRKMEREELLATICRLLRANRAIWSTVGPGGPEGEKVQSSTVGQWRRQLRETVIPNNWRIIALATHNDAVLTEEELTAIAEFGVHTDALAYNALADEPVEGQPRFPESMQRHFE
jgi:hypothetical protein